MSRRRASTSGGVAPKPHKMLGYGAGGLAELQENLLSDDCCFCLLTLILGSGSLARAKSVFFAWTGPDVGAIKRSKFLTHKEERLQDINGASLNFNADSYDDITPEAILDILKRNVTVDDGDVELSLDLFKVEPPPPAPAPIEEKIETVVEEAGEAAEPGRRVRQGGDLSTILGLCRQEVGGLNWFIATGDPKNLQVVDSGKQGLIEMVDAIKEDGNDKCYYGLCQLVIGSGAGKKIKFGLIVWIGETLGAVKKGKASNAATQIENEDLFGHSHFSIHAMDAEELTPEIVIEKLKSSCVDDDLDYEISFEEVVAASVVEEAAPAPAVEERKEEEKVTAGRAGGDPGTPEYIRANRSKFTRTFKDVIDEVKDQDGQLNWAMFE